MTIAEQVFEAFGITDGTRRRMVRAGRNMRDTGRTIQRTVQRRGEPWLEPIPSQYLWLGLGVAAAAAATFMMRSRMPFVGGRRVGDVMVQDVLTIDASATLTEAAQIMRDNNVGVLPVVDRGRLSGVITDRDLVVRAMARGMDAGATPVRYVASEDLACARPEWDVEDAMRVMSASQVGRLPVVDDDNRVVGIITLSSLALRAKDERDTLHAAQEVSRRSARVAS